MTNLLAFDTVTPPAGAPLRLRRVSHALSILFTALMAGTIALAATWIVIGVFFGNHMSIGKEGVVLSFPKPPPAMPGHVFFSDQRLVTRLAGFLAVVMGSVPVLLVLAHLRGLFALYARGTVFARENAAHLKRIGLWLIAYPFVKFASNAIFRLAGGTDEAWLRAELVDALVLGAIVLAIAQVMELGREIEQDSAEIV